MGDPRALPTQAAGHPAGDLNSHAEPVPTTSRPETSVGTPSVAAGITGQIDISWLQERQVEQ